MQSQSQSTESAWFYDLLVWLEVNKKKVLYGSCAALVVFAGVYLYMWHSERTEVAASTHLLALRVLPSEKDDQPAASAEDFRKVALQYPSTRAAERAQLLSAGTLYAEGKYKEAEEQFQKFMSDNGDSPLAAVALLGVAASQDAQDKIDAAMSSYQSVTTRYPNDPAARRAKLGMATLYEAKNQPTNAMRIYQELNNPALFGESAMEASRRMESLVQKHPELAPTNVTAALTTPPTISPTIRSKAPVPPPPKAPPIRTTTPKGAK
jgi:predicted negative regulator of RcsB-dependent stress response